MTVSYEGVKMYKHQSMKDGYIHDETALVETHASTTGKLLIIVYHVFSECVASSLDNNIKHYKHGRNVYLVHCYNVEDYPSCKHRIYTGCFLLHGGAILTT